MPSRSAFVEAAREQSDGPFLNSKQQAVFKSLSRRAAILRERPASTTHRDSLCACFLVLDLSPRAFQDSPTSASKPAPLPKAPRRFYVLKRVRPPSITFSLVTLQS